MPGTADNRINRVLKTVCAVLIAFVASQIVLELAGIPRFYQRVTTGTVAVVTVAGETGFSNELVAQWAAARGMGLETYAAYFIALQLVSALGFVSVGVLILLKARREWFHWFTAFVLLFYPTGGLWNFTRVSQVASGYVGLGAILWPCFPLFLYLFPNGRAVPRWTRWLMGALACFHLVVQGGYLAVTMFGAPNELAAALSPFIPLVGVVFPVIFACQVYRYRRGSTPAERAQIKWFVGGLALFAIGTPIEAALGVTGTDDLGFYSDVDSLLTLLVPATIGLAILRYRLYDIDVIIRRTLTYSAVTAALALVYWGSVVLLQGLFRGLTGQGSDLAIVASTLTIAALFQPGRRRIQGFINRRFYRRDYDAARTLASFSTSLRDEVDLTRLTDQLVAVVEETMQPTVVARWLRQDPPPPARGWRAPPAPRPPL